MHWVYVLRCSDQSLYVGETNDLDGRVIRHIGGFAAYTSSRRPVALVYSEVFENRVLALGRERQIKRWSRAKKEALINGDLNLLRRL